GADHNLERRNRTRPDYAAIIVILLDGCRGYAADADAVATHLHDDRFAVGLQKGGVQCTRVLITQEKDVTHLDAALDAQSTATRIRIAVHYIAQIESLRFRQVPLPVDAGVVVALIVCTTSEVVHPGHGEVGNDIYRLAGVQRAQITGHAAEMVYDFLFSSEAVTVFKAGQL